MRQRVVDVLHSSVIETGRKEQKEFKSHAVDKTCGIQRLPYRDDFGEFRGCTIVEARRDF